MIASLVIAGGMAVTLAVILLALRNAKQTGRQEVRKEQAIDTAIETKGQADVMVEHRTDADVVAGLRSKAAAKRKREAERNR